MKPNPSRFLPLCILIGGGIIGCHHPTAPAIAPPPFPKITQNVPYPIGSAISDALLASIDYHAPVPDAKTRTLFMQNCSACHSIRTAGLDHPPHCSITLNHVGLTRTQDWLRTTIRNPKHNGIYHMPAHTEDELSNRDMNSLVHYLSRLMQPKLGSVPIQREDLLNPPDFVMKLKDSPDPLSQFLRSRFSANTQRLLQNFPGKGAPSKPLLRALLYELNGQLFYNKVLLVDQPFVSQMAFSKEMEKLIKDYRAREMRWKEADSENTNPSLLLCRLMLVETYHLRKLGRDASLFYFSKFPGQ